MSEWSGMNKSKRYEIMVQFWKDPNLQEDAHLLNDILILLFRIFWLSPLSLSFVPCLGRFVVLKSWLKWCKWLRSSYGSGMQLKHGIERTRRKSGSRGHWDVKAYFGKARKFFTEKGMSKQHVQWVKAHSMPTSILKCKI